MNILIHDIAAAIEREACADKADDRLDLRAAASRRALLDDAPGCARLGFLAREVTAPAPVRVRAGRARRQG